MERIFTEQELAIIDQLEQQFRLRGIIADNGNPLAVENLKTVLTPFSNNPNAPVTFDGLLTVLNRVGNKLHYTSKIAKQLASSQLTSAEMNELQDFLRRKPLVKLDGSYDGHHNAVLLVEWLRRYNYPIHFDSLS